ncbi:MAG: hypothetical protein GXP31_01470 [Kiritimatiellaeota bacterium]|nr:hypothetical protein [Kiritimatiellota bacterium]
MGFFRTPIRCQRREMLVFGAWLSTAAAGLNADAPAVQSKSAEWCKVTVPAKVAIGERVEVRLQLTGFDRPVWVSCDLKDQDHRMLTWGGPPRKLDKGGEAVWRPLVPDKPDIRSVYAFLYVTRGQQDGWKKAVATVATPFVAVSGRSPFLDLMFNKSWIHVDAANRGKPLVSGDRWEVPVEYYLDPSEHFGKTMLTIWGTGPWIDTPDGKYAKKRGHIGYRGLASRIILTQPGRGRHVFVFTVPPGLDLVRRYNPVLFVASFRDGQGRPWPWHVRAHSRFVRRRGFFELEHLVPGNLFTYDQPVRLAVRLKNVQEKGEKKELRYTVWDTRGEVVARGSVPFTVKEDGQRVPVTLDLDRRGVFLVEFDVPGWEKRTTTLGRIPDLEPVLAKGPTRFGMTNHYDAPPEEVWAVARRLGLSACRRFTRWYSLEPGPGEYRLDALRKELETAARYGVREWLCIVEPPPFAFVGKAKPPGYHPFDFRRDAWRAFVRTVTTRLQGRFLGWEWLNEILAGNCADPAGTYVDMVRIGSETAKAVDPNLLSILAGGLYPRDYRKAVLNAGVGRWIDVLPVHYQNGDGIMEARGDLDAAGLTQVAVWDDETARGVNAWGVPPLEDIRNTEQAEWVLRQWPDELGAGCGRIVYFGGRGSAAGSWDYLLDDLAPRPVAGTLAVLVSKLHHTRALGAFPLGTSAVFHLFERDGRSILVGSTDLETGERVRLPTGAEKITLTDWQGNETVIATDGDGTATLVLRRMPVFIEGVAPATVSVQVVAEIATARPGAGTSANVRAARRTAPRVTVLRGRNGRVPIHLNNPLRRRILAGTCRVLLPAPLSAPPPVRFSLGPGAQQSLTVPLHVPEQSGTGAVRAQLQVAFDAPDLPRVERAFVLNVLSPGALGNQLRNGDFEAADATGRPVAWHLAPDKVRVAPAPQDTPGLGRRVLRFEGSMNNWLYASNSVPVQGGQTYLYTAWVRNTDMHCGSNLTFEFADGKTKTLFDTQVFQCGENSTGWQLYTCRKTFPENAVRAVFSPVARGAGVGMFDNVRVTLFEGSDYTAEVLRASRSPMLDGRLDDWRLDSPIPLIGRNQITARSPAYRWTPENVSAAVYLMWDEANLYLAVDVRDDRHIARSSQTPDGRGILEGDCLVLALDPTGRGPEAGNRAFALYVSSAPPGGGSGRFTVFRPPTHSGGRRTGHLFRDSSVFGMAFRRKAGGCVYELRIPATELGTRPVLGTRLGFSVQIHDRDASNLSATLTWAEGLHPAWAPGAFGIVTLTR